MQEAGDRVAAKIESLVAAALSGVPPDPARVAVLTVIEENRRRRTGEAIIAGYQRVPQDEDELRWSAEATRRMAADEPW